MHTTVGIDLGTTNCCVYFINNEIATNAEGERTTPSVVAFTEDGQRLVGSIAKRQRVTNPTNTLYGFKRLMGQKHADAVKKLKFPYKLVKADNGDVRIEATVDGKTQKLSPEEVSSYLLRKLKEDAEKIYNTEIADCVITVPAYFNDAQRQSTKDAGRIAGLNVMRIINEPTAAALAYGLDKKKGERKVAVYDLGGGTFDVSVIEIAEVDGEHQFEVLATNGDTFLGGEDFDEKLIDHLVSQFKKDNGVDLSNDTLALQRLKEAAEKAKIELSSAMQTEVNLPFITANQSGPLHLNVKITRAQFEGMVKDLIERSMKPCQVALKDAQLDKGDIDEVILVGGQTRMPAVKEAVRNFFGKEPMSNVNPDEAVAMGAAIQAGVLKGEVNDVLLLDVTPLSLGIETMGGVMTKLIEKNTTIPSKKSQIFSTAENNQSAVTIHVLQGEREMASANKSLGRFDLANIPPAPRGMPQIEVTFDIDANGILNVSATDKATGKAQSIVIKSSGGLSDEEVERMIREAEENAEEDKKFHELVTQRNEADATIHQSEEAIEGLDDVSDDERSAIEAAVGELKTAKDGSDLDEIKAKTEALRQASAEVMKRFYEKKSADNQANDAQPEGQTGGQAADDDAMDADFEEVKDDDSK